MTTRAQRLASSVALTTVILAVVIFTLLVFRVPKLIAHWQAADHELAAWEVLVVRASIFSTTWGWPLLVLLFFALVAAAGWRLRVELQHRRAA